MYVVDGDNRVVTAGQFPPSSVGAPLPTVVAVEGQLLLAYLMQDTPRDWDGTTVRVVDHDSAEPAAVIEFEGVVAHYLGAPNDEAFRGHPLASRGLEPYGAFTVENSSRIRRLEAMNRVHPHHRADAFLRRTHFVFAFHDSTFECVASSAAESLHLAPLGEVVAEMLRRMY